MTSRARMTVGIAALAGLLVGVWLLSPILTPFVFAAGLAYLDDPPLVRLDVLRILRPAALATFFSSLSHAAASHRLLLVPTLQDLGVTTSLRMPYSLSSIR